MNTNWLIALCLFPIFAIILRAGIALPIEWLIRRYMKGGWLKALLTRKFGGSKTTLNTHGRGQ